MNTLPLISSCVASLPLALGCSGGHESGPQAVPQDETAISATDAAQEDKGGSTTEAKVATAVPLKSDRAVASLREFIKSQEIDKSIEQWKVQLPLPPKAEFDEQHEYFWNFTTSKGPIKIRLMPSVAPLHVSSTIYLTELGFYDGLAFHRVIPGFMAQGGCPRGDGSGNPGYGYDGEFDPDVRHDRAGILSMANTGRPGSDGSQFFLTFGPTPHLDDKHTIFGEVVDGMETVRKIQLQGTGGGATKERLLLEKATITIEQKQP